MNRKKEPSAPSLKEQVYKEIIEMITKGGLESGGIITEKQMIQKFGVSKSPVREALLQLCNEDVLMSIPRCGYQVTPISPKQIHDLSEMRLILELSCFDKVASSITDQMLDEVFQPTIDARFDRNKDLWIAHHNNIRFHMTLVNYAGNEQISKTVNRIFNVFTRAYAQLYTSRRSAVDPPRQNWHDLFVAALRKKDIMSAREYLRQDIALMDKELL